MKALEHTVACMEMIHTQMYQMCTYLNKTLLLCVVKMSSAYCPTL